MRPVDGRSFPGVGIWVAGAVLLALVGAGALALRPIQGRSALMYQLQRRATLKRTPSSTEHPPAAARFVRHSSTGYSVAVTLSPNRATGPIRLSLHAVDHGRSLNGARIRIGFSMPSMNMWSAYTAALRATGGGRYAATIPVLGMAGSWRLLIDLTPRSGRPLRIVVDDRLVA